MARMHMIGVRQGKTAVATAAYIGAEDIKSEMTGVTYRFSEKAGHEYERAQLSTAAENLHNAAGHNDVQAKTERVLASEVILPEGANPDLNTPAKLWNAVEMFERQMTERFKPGMREHMQGKMRFAKHLMIALPRDEEVSIADMVTMVKEFAREQFVKHGLAVQWAIHVDDMENPHAHLLITTRRMDVNANLESQDLLEPRFKTIALDKARDLEPRFIKGRVTHQDHWHLRWRDYQESYFKRNGINLHVDPFRIVPSKHIGPAAYAIDGDVLARMVAENDAGKEMAADAIRKEPEVIIRFLTENMPIFTRRELAVALLKNGFDQADDYRAVEARVLGHASVVQLYDPNSHEAVDAYTTVQQKETDERVVAIANDLAKKRGHAVSNEFVDRYLKTVADKHDAAAVRYLVTSPDLAPLRGGAGTGKNANLKVAVDIWKEQGFEVWGAAPTNTVTADLTNKLGIDSQTITLRVLGFQKADRFRREVVSGEFSSVTIGEMQASLGRWHMAAAFPRNADGTWKVETEEERGKREKVVAHVQRMQQAIAAGDDTQELRSWQMSWLDRNIERLSLSDRHVFIVEEAGMVDSRDMLALAREAHRAGAKLVVSGDEAYQLDAIRAGLPFADIVERFPGYKLEEVHRQRLVEDRAAAKSMSDDGVRGITKALKHHEARGRLHFEKNMRSAKNALGAHWLQSVQNHPDKFAFIFAATNKDADEMNKLARAALVNAGVVEKGEAFETGYGKLHFAVGDQIQFRATRKSMGLFNGDVGVIKRIEGNRFTVGLSHNGEEVSWSLDDFDKFSYGWAGTIYRGQGKTIDNVYLLYTDHWDHPVSNVAMTRFRDDVHVFVDERETYNVASLAFKMGREAERRSTTNFMTAEQVQSIRSARRSVTIDRLAAVERPVGLDAGAGWTLRLNVGVDKDGDLLRGITSDLDSLGLKYSVNSIEGGRELVAHVGGYDAAKAVAIELQGTYGSRLHAPTEGAVATDQAFAGYIYGYFGTEGDQRFHVRGEGGGIPLLKGDLERFASWNNGPRPGTPEHGLLTDQCMSKADAELASSYGEFYTGKGRTGALPDRSAVFAQAGKPLPVGEDAGWVLKVRVTGEDPIVTVDQITENLSQRGIAYEVNLTDASAGVRLDVLAGSRDFAAKLAGELEKGYGGSLAWPAPEDKPQLQRFTNKVWGAFDAAGTEGFHSDTAFGIPLKERDLADVVLSTSPDTKQRFGQMRRASIRADETLTNLYGAYYAGGVKAPAHTIGLEAMRSNPVWSAGRAPEPAHERAVLQEMDKLRIHFDKLSPEAKATLTEIAAARLEYEKEQIREQSERYSAAQAEFRFDRAEGRYRHSAAWRANRVATSVGMRVMSRLPVVGEITHFYMMGSNAIKTRGKSLPGAIAHVLLRNVPGGREMMMVYSAAKFLVELGIAAKKISQAADAQRKAQQARQTAADVRPSKAPRPAGEAFRATGANSTSSADFAMPARPGEYPVDSLGRDLSPAAINRAIDADNRVMTLRGSLNTRIRAIYEDPAEALKRLDGMVSRYGHIEVAERLKRAPTLLGEFAGKGSTERMESALDLVRRNVLGDNVQALGNARSMAERAYRDDVGAQLRFDAEPLADLSPRAREAVEQIAGARNTVERAAVYREMMKNRPVSAEVQAFVERASRKMQGGRPAAEAPAVAVKKMGRILSGVSSGRGALPDTVAPIAKALMPAATSITEAVTGATAISRIVRLVQLGEKAVRAADRIARGIDRGRGGQGA